VLRAVEELPRDHKDLLPGPKGSVTKGAQAPGSHADDDPEARDVAETLQRPELAGAGLISLRCSCDRTQVRHVQGQLSAFKARGPKELQDSFDARPAVPEQ